MCDRDDFYEDDFCDEYEEKPSGKFQNYRGVNHRPRNHGRNEKPDPFKRDSSSFWDEDGGTDCECSTDHEDIFTSRFCDDSFGEDSGDDGFGGLFGDD